VRDFLAAAGEGVEEEAVVVVVEAVAAGDF
jgi:hypothetical protein